MSNAEFRQYDDDLAETIPLVRQSCEVDAKNLFFRQVGFYNLGIRVKTGSRIVGTRALVFWPMIFFFFRRVRDQENQIVDPIAREFKFGRGKKFTRAALHDLWDVVATVWGGRVNIPEGFSRDIAPGKAARIDG